MIENGYFRDQLLKPLIRQIRVLTSATCDSRDRCAQFKTEPLTMKKILLLTFFAFLTLISCSGDDSSTKSDEDYLHGTWTIKKTTTYYYVNGELDTTKESILKEPYSTLNFAQNYEVTYSNPDFTEPIIGVWGLNEKKLVTDLNLELSTSSGYSSIYFFPENTITSISETDLILKSQMSIERTSSNGDKFKKLC